MKQTVGTCSRARSVDRRTFLRGAGVGLALPLLDCMRQAAAGSEGDYPRRMLLISNNLGVLPTPFFPQSAGSDYELSPYLEELRDFRPDFSVFSGLSHPGVVGGHSTENCFLTAAKGPTRSGFRNTISLDQFAAERLGQPTRFSTLNLGVNIDRANRSLSWTRDGVLLPAANNPRAVFEKMFVQGSPREVESRLQQLRLRKSILDAVAEETRRFRRGLGRDDRSRLDQYFTSVRELEQQLDVARQWQRRAKPETDHRPPEDIEDKSQFFQKFQLMLSLAQLALESDSTRIVTLMVDAFATPVFQIDPQTKSLNGYHNLSHHGNVPEKLQQLESVDRRQMGLLRTLLAKLADRSEGPRRLLDHTMVLYGSNMGDSNTHDNRNLPVLLAGGGFQHNRHFAFDRHENTPLCNLFVSMLRQLGVEAERFGSSTGTLTGLA